MHRKTYLVSIGVEDRDNSSALRRVEILKDQLSDSEQTWANTDFVRVPGCGSRSSLALSVSDHRDRDLVRPIHYASIRDCQAVSELTTFVNSARRFGVDV